MNSTDLPVLQTKFELVIKPPDRKGARHTDVRCTALSEKQTGVTASGETVCEDLVSCRPAGAP
jgi:hypothetical protein